MSKSKNKEPIIEVEILTSYDPESDDSDDENTTIKLIINSLLVPNGKRKAYLINSYDQVTNKIEIIIYFLVVANVLV